MQKTGASNDRWSQKRRRPQHVRSQLTVSPHQLINLIDSTHDRNRNLHRPLPARARSVRCVAASPASPNDIQFARHHGRTQGRSRDQHQSLELIGVSGVRQSLHPRPQECRVPLTHQVLAQWRCVRDEDPVPARPGVRRSPHYDACSSSSTGSHLIC